MAKSTPDPRRRLLDAGLKLFANRGYAGTAVQDIADEAGVTKPTLYYYFGNKEGLFQALVDRAMDERLRLMQEAAPPEKATVDQMTDIIVALTDFARREPDLLRLTFAVAFAADGEYPTGFNKHRIDGSIEFVKELVERGLARGELNPGYALHELTQSFFQLIQHSIVMAIIEPKMRRLKSPYPLPPPMEPQRKVELFLRGAAHPHPAGTNGHTHAGKKKRAHRLAVPLAALLALVPADAHAQATNAPAAPTPTAPLPPDSATSNTATTTPPDAAETTGPTPLPPDVRPIPLAVQASHPELATVSPILANAQNPHALDLQGCFQLTAVRDDSLKISMEDIEIARAQMSQSIAALWPTFTVNNQQTFLHYIEGSGSGFTIRGDSTIASNRNYTSQSNVQMSYTVFNGGQNWNNVGASAAAVAAKKQTLARSYETIYQDVAQAFYNVLQYEGDLNVQADLVAALQARVEDLTDRVKLGRSRPSELLQAQTDLANAKVTLESQRGSLNAAKETVAFYTGVPAVDLELKDTQKFPSAAQLESYVQQSGTRPDVLSQLESMRQAERNLSVAIGQLWPTITANGDFLASQDPATNSVDGSFTIEASMPIFDGGLIAAQIHQNHELVRQNRLNVEQLRRTADQDTRTAYVNFDSAVAQVVVLREAARLAARNFEAQVDDYRRGVVSNLDVLTALQDYQSARIQLHNVNMTARLDLINLNVAAGLAARGPGADNHALPATVTGTAH
jgi:outer membrane protein